jgi:hypothetical protein
MGRRGLSVRLFPWASCYSFQLDEGAHRCNGHVLDHFQTAGQRRLVRLLGILAGVIPNLAVGAFTVPAKVAVRNRLQRKELETAQHLVLFRHLYLVAQNVDAHEPFIGIQQLVVEDGSTRFITLLAHGRKYSGSVSEKNSYLCDRDLNRSAPQRIEQRTESLASVA